MKEHFGITVTSQMRHAALWKARKKVGNSKLLAEKLGVSYGDIGDWINLRSVPPFLRVRLQEDVQRENRLRGWPLARQAALEQALFELTGQTLDVLFPPALCSSKEFLAAAKRIETTREIPHDHLLAADYNTRLLLPSPADVVAENLDQEDLAGRLRRAITSFPDRSQKILIRRWGLDGKPPGTYGELAKEFGIAKERVRQIESKVLRTLQRDENRAKLAEFLPAGKDTDAVLWELRAKEAAWAHATQQGFSPDSICEESRGNKEVCLATQLHVVKLTDRVKRCQHFWVFDNTPASKMIHPAVMAQSQTCRSCGSTRWIYTISLERLQDD